MRQMIAVPMLTMIGVRRIMDTTITPLALLEKLFAEASNPKVITIR